MAAIEGGQSAALIDVGANTKAGRVEPRPVDVGALGSYVTSIISGTMAAGLAGGATILACRWGSASATMILRGVRIGARNAGTAFAAGPTLFELVQARSWSAPDSGGSIVNLSGNNGKRRTTFGTSLLSSAGDLRASTTAALTAGTRTLDSLPVAQIRGYVPATAVNYPFIGQGLALAPGASTFAWSLAPQDLYRIDHTAEWPLTFVQNEGFILRATVPATGTWEFIAELEWSEVAPTAGFN